MVIVTSADATRIVCPANAHRYRS